MIIAVDAGNSTIHFGCFGPQGLFATKIPCQPGMSPEGYGAVLNDLFVRNRIEEQNVRVIISSVVEGVGERLADAFAAILPSGHSAILTLSHTMNLGLSLDVIRPEKVGSDRIASAAGAYERVRAAVAVADVGTATTLSFVDDHARFIGGSILPGLQLMNRVLEERTSRLAKVRLEAPDAALGKETRACILSGIYYGTAGAIEKIVAATQDETNTRFALILTGGNAEQISRFLKLQHEVLPNLTLEGLKLIDEKNRHA